MRRILAFLTFIFIINDANSQANHVVANFEIDSTNKPYFTFTNTSTNAIQYRWTFLDVSPRPEIDDNHTELVISYDETPCDSNTIKKVGEVIPCNEKGMNFTHHKGNYYVCLEATGGYGDKDTACKSINTGVGTVRKSKPVQNVFTPNGDGKNDYFSIELGTYTKYELVVHNRWGQVVFESSDPNYNWDGTMMIKKEVQECPAGSYFWTLKYQLVGEGDMKKTSGMCTLIR